ncbi:MAG: hypothetical protein M3O46_04215, partial [Myxococcota bacterium]|nr:hypothetical protein [Myxococcota bacterium]
GKIVVPPSPNDTPAQAEFNQSYLGTLSGFPYESVARVRMSGPLDRSTVTGRNVIVLDVTTATQVTGAAPILDVSSTEIQVAPPPGGWARAHQYAIALVGGASGLRGLQNQPVIGSPAWALVSSPNALVDCPKNAAGQFDFTSPRCIPTVDVIPSTQTDPAIRLRDQTVIAIKLETIREGYAPILAQVKTIENLSDTESIPILWTFTIVDAGEVTFDPANGVIPFPNDVLLSSNKVALPDPRTHQPLLPSACLSASDTSTQLYCGLNTLDGFSTIAPPVSENGLTMGAVAQASLDPASLTAGTVGLIPLVSAAPTAEQTPPSFTPCLVVAGGALNCLSTPNQSSSPEQLKWRLDAPLDEKTTYLAYVTNDAKDDQGKSVIANPVFALVRSKTPIFVAGKSQVNVLTDAQAARLEPLRSAMQPALDALEAKVPRTNLALAWAFTTQSEATLLDQLYAYPSTARIQSLFPQGVFVFQDATLQYKAAATSGGVPVDSIGRFYVGVFGTPVAVTGPGGTLDLANPRPGTVTFALAVPDPAKVPQPAAGYPITIFGHGFTRDRNDFLAIANTLAKRGQATIATDAVFHGERSSCTGSAAYLTQLSSALATDDDACADPVSMKCNEDPLIGRCVARDRTTLKPCPGLNQPGPDPSGNLQCETQHLGACDASTGMCEGGDFKRDSPGGRPTISGWNMFSLTNFFSTRDNFRQQVIDLAQLVQMLRVTSGPSLVARINAAGGTTAFDLNNIGYVGQSLGGILGTLFNAVSPDTMNVALNVPGGDLPQIILNGASFAPYKMALLAGLTLQKPPILPGTPEFDQFLGIVQWILDPADPANLAWRLTHSVTLPNGVSAPNMKRKAFIQFIQDDQTVPNISNLALLSAANRPLSGTAPAFNCKSPLLCYEFADGTEQFDPTSVPLVGRHGFLLRPPGAMQPTPQSLTLTAKAQTQVATFLATGNYQ